MASTPKYAHGLCKDSNEKEDFERERERANG